MSSGRYSLIKEIINIDSNYTIDTLEPMSIQELRTLYFQLTGQEYSMHQQDYQQNHGKHHANRQ